MKIKYHKLITLIDYEIRTVYEKLGSLYRNLDEVIGASEILLLSYSVFKLVELKEKIIKKVRIF